MAPSRPRRPRLVLPTILAIALAAEITGLAIARSAVPSASTEAPAAPITAAANRSVDPRPDAARDALVSAAASNASTAEKRRPTSAAVAAPGRSTTTGTASHAPRAASSSKVPSTAFHGRNHVWIPSLGVNRSIQSFPCSRSRPPDAGVYRWGCAGSNNIYLLAHAWSTFKPLHDAYVSHRLRAGMKVWYADGAARVHAYRVVWWRVVAPTTAASWAWAAQSRPSMTLQTCVGANSQYRLMVRLLQVG